MATRPRSGTARRRPKSAGADAGAAAAEEADAPTPRTGAKRTVMSYVRQLPQYLRLLGGLIADPRVAMIDKLLVAGAMAYIVMPIDLIPDFIPFFGEIDDVYLLVLGAAAACLQRGARRADLPLDGIARRPRRFELARRAGGRGVLPAEADSPSSARDRTDVRSRPFRWT